MRPVSLFVCSVLLLVCLGANGVAAELSYVPASVRVLSWNVSDDGFVTRPVEFASILAWANPDIVLLDEVAPTADAAYLVRSLSALRNGGAKWQISMGPGGGRQRCIIASIGTQEAVPEFTAVVPYPDADRDYILQHMSDADRANAAYSMEHGIPVNGSIVATQGGRLLVVIADLQCCGGSADSWQEYRRRAEAREIRRLVSQVLMRTAVDGVVIAGDFNLVQGPEVLQILRAALAGSGPGMDVAEPIHPDGVTVWTWDGRGTAFPSGRLDFQVFDPAGLSVRRGQILDTESAATEDLEQFGLDRRSSAKTGRHRPLVIEYAWR